MPKTVEKEEEDDNDSSFHSPQTSPKPLESKKEFLPNWSLVEEPYINSPSQPSKNLSFAQSLDQLQSSGSPQNTAANEDEAAIEEDLESLKINSNLEKNHDAETRIELPQESSSSFSPQIHRKSPERRSPRRSPEQMEITSAEVNGDVFIRPLPLERLSVSVI